MALIDARVTDLQSQVECSADERVIAMLKRDRRYWQTRQITADVATTPRGDRVEFGARVDVLLNGRLRNFEIVGDDEADPAVGLISFTAPLSRALLGAELGEIVPFGGVPDALRILEISAGASAGGL